MIDLMSYFSGILKRRLLHVCHAREQQYRHQHHARAIQVIFPETTSSSLGSNRTIQSIRGGLFERSVLLLKGLVLLSPHRPVSSATSIVGSARRDGRDDRRLPSRALLSKIIYDLQHFFSAGMRIHRPSAHAHGDFIVRIGRQQLLHQQIPHFHAHVHAAVRAVFLLGAVCQIGELELLPEELFDLSHSYLGVVEIGRGERVVVECHLVQDAHEEE